jgi:GntR family transcriptional regulator
LERLPIRLSQASGVPFYRQIRDQLAGLIRSGQLAPNARLPSYRELAPQLLVSLITLRRAYAELETDGLIVSRQGQGTFVAGEIETASRRQAIGEARALLEVAVMRARQLGLRGEPLRLVVDRLLEQDPEAGRRAKSARGRTDGRE